MNHIAVDLETLALHRRAPIISIGACEFDDKNILRKFYVNVSLESNMAVGRTPSASTIEWWLQQSDAARFALLNCDKVELKQALEQFNEFVAQAGPDVRLWANGSLQDTLWLETAFDDVGIKPNWGYRIPACFRTMRDSFPPLEVDSPGEVHNALDDALWEALYLQELNREYKLDIL